MKSDQFLFVNLSVELENNYTSQSRLNKVLTVNI